MHAILSWIRGVLVAAAVLGAAALADSRDRFTVDLESRRISVRQDGALHPLLGVEPILGAEDGSLASGPVLEFLENLVGEAPLRLEAEDRDGTLKVGVAAYAFLPDGRMVNEELVREGFARAVTSERYRARARLVAAEGQARAEVAGLWSAFAAKEVMARPPGVSHPVYRVFYATDRLPTGKAAPNDRFGPDRGSGLSYGTCDVSIPPDHRMGGMERPSIWRLEFREDPEKHIVLLAVTEAPGADAFFGELSGQVSRSAGREALVFIHGYNVDFAEAARRTAQIAYDLSFDGAPILYSWPSRGKLLDYAADAATADWSAEHLRAFLADLTARSGATTIHLVAHSMGNRVLTGALKGLAAGGGSFRFNQVVLTAPDIDAQMFREQIVPAIRGTADRITLYASSEDEALKASKSLHGAPRAGDSGAGIVVVEGLDTIDVSKLDTSLLGHSYFADSRSVITDMFGLIHDRKPPGQRAGLVAMPAGTLTYWAFKP